MSFEKIVRIRPAYDRRSEGYGICACVMLMVLKGEKGAVVFSMNTSWFLPETKEWKESCIERSGIDTWEPSGNAVSYCSPIPIHEWQKDNGRENCDWLGCTCYGDQGYTMSDVPMELLLRKGDIAVWEYLEDYYNKIFNTLSSNT